MTDLEVPLADKSQDEKQALNPATDDDHDPMDDLDEDEPKPHCMGHRFHWSEIFFIILVGAGFAFLFLQPAVDASSIVGTIIYAVYLAGALTATSLMWNLVSIKRIAAASEMLRNDVKKFRAENNRAKALQQKNKENDAKMKANLADLEKASLLLKGSVNGLEEIQKEEEAMLQERQELLGQRKEIAGKLEVNMNKLWELTIDSVRSEMEKRIMDVFQDLSAPNPTNEDEDGIVVGSGPWNELISIVEEYGVSIDENDESEFGLKTVAGDDKFLALEEFEKWWAHAEEKHFTALIAILRRNRDLEDRIRSLELGMPEKDEDTAEPEVLISV